MRFHLYIFFTMFCVHSFFCLCFSFHYAYLMSNCCLSKNDKRAWLTRWPPRSFANPIWHSVPLCLHWSTIVPLCFHLLYCSLMVGLLHAMAFMMLLLVGWVIWNNKPLAIVIERFSVESSNKRSDRGSVQQGFTNYLLIVLSERQYHHFRLSAFPFFLSNSGRWGFASGLT